MPTSKDGGDPITYYLLEWDNGDSTKLESDTWTELTSSSAGIKTQFIQLANPAPFVNNTVFRYRMKAKNGAGFGDYSDVTSITSDRSPL